MPRRVQVSVRNCAIPSSTFAVMSWSSRIIIDVKASNTATTKLAVEMPFSNFLAFTMSLIQGCKCQYQPHTRR